MQFTARVIVALFGVIALATGGAALIQGLGASPEAVLLDNNYRFFAGIWFVVGLGLIHGARDYHGSRGMIRLFMLALIVGGLGRALGVIYHPVETRIIVAILIETVLPAAVIGATFFAQPDVVASTEPSNAAT